ncbi:MAG: hypothetical protein PHF86_02190 [Candidatus Nanoarchaeia archaeon]|nr:hypothetical protein [Candidatus Nanoarchaeia archaeon]
MNLITKVKPSKCIKTNKQDIISSWRLYGYTVSNYGQYWGDDDKYIYVINFEKFNKKTKQSKKVVKGKNVTTSKIIRGKHWVGYLYKIPKTWLEASNKKVIQKTRNFCIVSKN